MKSPKPSVLSGGRNAHVRFRVRILKKKFYIIAAHIDGVGTRIAWEEMRRPGGAGHYGADNNPHGYAAAAVPPPLHIQQQQQQNKSDHHHHNPWRWERDGSKLQSPMSPHMFNEGQGSEASRSYYQGQRPDPRMPLDKLGSHDQRSQPQGEEMDIGYEENPIMQTFEGLEQKFLDDIMKLSKEQNDAEDAEIARHRERINTINVQYQDQLVALRSRHASRRDEFLQRESHSRKQQYQQAAFDLYPGGGRVPGGIGPSDAQGFSTVGPPPRETHRPYSTDNYEPYRERARFLGSARNHDIEPRVQYPGGRVYDTGSRYY